MALRIVEQAGRTDVGRQRSANEDALVLSPPFFAVADGMGGARAGEVASSLAAGVFGEQIGSGEAPETQLTRIAQEANRRIFELAATDESHRGMGTTLTAAKVHDDEVSLGHVGDSRAYLLRDGRARAAHPRPLAGGRARAHRPDHPGGRGAPSSALDHHARARARAARGRGHVHRDGPRRGPLPDLLGRAHEHGHATTSWRRSCARRSRWRTRRRRSCAPPTRAAGRTTSPWCCSAWPTRTERRPPRPRTRRSRARSRRTRCAAAAPPRRPRRPPGWRALPPTRR